jgi:hypothetical protein
MITSIYWFKNIYNQNLLLSFITYDSLLSSFIFFLHIIDSHKLNNIISFITNIPQISLLKRYIFYCIAYFNLLILKILLWDKYNIDYISYILLLSAYPPLLYILINIKPINNIINYFYNQIINIYKSLFSYIIANILNITINGFTHNPSNITYTEIINIFNNINSDNLLDTCKILFISIISYYVEFEMQNKFNTKIISYLYNHKYILNLKDNYFKNDVYKNISDPKEKIQTIINNRRWDLCFHPRIFKLLIHISIQSKNNNILALLWSYITYYEYYLIKFMSFYSIISFIQLLNISINFIVLLSFIIKIYENDKILIGFICRLLAILYYYKFSNLIIFSLISECLEILFNIYTKNIIYFIYNKYKYHYQIIFHKNKYIYSLFSQIILLYYISLNFDYKLLIILLLSKKDILFIFFTLFGFLSNYNIYHLICLSLLFHCSYNIYQYIYNEYKIDKLNIDLIKSYITKKNNEKSNINIDIIDNFFHHH